MILIVAIGLVLLVVLASQRPDRPGQPISDRPLTQSQSTAESLALVVGAVMVVAFVLAVIAAASSPSL